MSYGIFSSVAFTVASGVAVAPSATVTVLNESDGSAATLYADAEGATAKANVFSADADGRFSFYAAGRALGYRVTVVSGAESATLRNVPVGNAMYLDTDAFVATADLDAVETLITDHIADAAAAHAASAVSFTPAGSVASTDVQAAIAEVDGDVTGHVSDAVAAHAASAVSFSPTGSVAATTVQAAIAEVDGDVTGHVSDASAAHAASAISYSGGTGMSATDVEAALDELATEKANSADIPGKTAIPIPASAMTPRSADGCAGLATTSGASGQPDIPYLAFDGAAKEYAGFLMRMPKSWNESTVTASFAWRRASGTGAANVVWGIRALAVSDNDTPAANFGSDATVTDGASTTTANFNLSGETGACTIAGSPAEGDLVFFEIFRDGASGSDTLDAVDALLTEFTLFITLNATNDA